MMRNEAPKTRRATEKTLEQKYKAPTTGQIVEWVQENKESQYLWRMPMLVADIRARFSIKSILAIIGEPTYKAINEV